MSMADRFVFAVVWLALGLGAAFVAGVVVGTTRGELGAVRRARRAILRGRVPLDALDDVERQAGGAE